MRLCAIDAARTVTQQVAKAVLRLGANINAQNLQVSCR